MSNDNDHPNDLSEAGRKPDFDVVQMLGNGEKARFVNIGALWQIPASGNLVGDTVHGKMLIKPRTGKDELLALRARQSKEKSQNQHLNP